MSYFIMAETTDSCMDLIEKAKLLFESKKLTNIQKESNVIIATPVEIKKLPNKEDVYNMEVEEVHNFVANRIVVHNCRYIIIEFKETDRAPVV